MTQGRPRTFDREEVLAKAMDLFWSHGYESLGMSELLEGLGIPRQSFYNTFGSKEDIFLEAFELYIKSMRETFGALLRDADTPLDGLKGMFAFMEGMVDSGGCAGCLVGNTMAEFGQSNPRIAEVMNNALDSKELMLTQTFQGAIDAGQLPSKPGAASRARTLMAMNQGLALMSKTGKSTADIKDALCTARDLLLR